MTKRPVYTTTKFIADILSFTENQEALSRQMEETSIDWDQVVVIGSKHLMLPALYCRLKAKKLIALIPEDLSVYLKEISHINRGRNEVLLTEAREISEIFKKENIDHVFIKGIALIAGHSFKDPAERMLTDIDVLVAENQLQNAFDLLTKYGYTETVTGIIERINHRHLPRQVSPQKFGAIELHSEILRHEHRHLIVNEQVLKNKRIVNGICIPSIEDAIKISILAFQINDKAQRYVYFAFKPIYDCLAINLTNKPVVIENLSGQKHSQSFLAIASVFFKEMTPIKSSNYSKLLRHYFTLSLRYPILRKVVYSITNILVNIYVRLNLLLYNKSYRRHLLKNKIGLKFIK
ncbi:nucleotidyltransferase family protein [Gelidibacter maritimus]|uniref:Nucleotidyltransferase family protein n=1 Tax=Gelidibacter maritimus TaxID=2761487 RepID=A0A7W2R443_9FLAO|nr:nucleotidyltransferase family protein [Gelidibacter maritimus]MBA6153434.1 nucleotidyltransferase family protein [Gelidibacter maritimus]